VARARRAAAAAGLVLRDVGRAALGIAERGVDAHALGADAAREAVGAREAAAVVAAGRREREEERKRCEEGLHQL
jgi:hypothetical protein